MRAGIGRHARPGWECRRRGSDGRDGLLPRFRPGDEGQPRSPSRRFDGQGGLPGRGRPPSRGRWEGGNVSCQNTEGAGDGTDFGDFVGSKKIGFPKNGKDGEEGLCRADLVLKQLECMGEGMTDGPTEGAEPERVEKGFGLVSDSGGAVLKIFIVEAESRIDPDGVNPCMDSTVDFAFGL